MRFIPLAVVLAAVSSAPAYAYTCRGGGVPTQASCGGDDCQCAAACSTNEQCVSGCCDQGFCAVACVCAGEGTVTLNCQETAGCGSVAPAGAPVSGFQWGGGLVAVGLLASASARRRRGAARRATAVVGLSVALLGGTFLAASAAEAPAAAAPAKSLR